jgi:hypothetical protein
MLSEKDTKTIAELFADLSHETQRLLYDMMELAKTEMAQKASLASRDMVLMAAGGVLAHGGLLVLLGAVSLLLALVMPLWLSAFIVGVVAVLVGYILLQEGRKDLRRKGLLPRQTIEEIKEEKEWARKEMT